jgi:dTMP kinase
MAQEVFAQGVFIAIEGGDGTGKSGVVARLSQALRAAGHEVIATREPGGTPEAEQLRALLLAGEDAAWEPASELLLMTAARVQHVRRLIEPALARGAVVISDRFVGSTLAYQGAGRGFDQGFIRLLHREAVGDRWPDLTLILDCPVEVALDRSRARLGRLGQTGVDEGRFETLDLGFHQRIRAAFLDQAGSAPQRHAVIDASAPPDRVQEAALVAVQQFMARQKARP